MFMDDIKNEYFYPMGGTSVVLEFNKNWVSYGKEGTAVVHPTMARFIDALRVKRPTWRFKSTERVYDNERQELRNFDVYDGDEQLGRVWTERHWRTGEDRYCLNNHRVEASRQRGSGSFSTKVAVATKKVLDSFGVKSLDELAVDAAKKITGVLNNVYSNTSFTYSSSKQKAMKALATYIEDNWDTLKSYTTGCDHIDLRELREQHEAVSKAYHSLTNDGAATLFMHGDRMVMQRHDKPSSVVTFDQLTEKQRANLGMLKLMEDKAFVAGVGMRVDSETFFLLD
jgi:hypothetical protein